MQEGNKNRCGYCAHCSHAAVILGFSITAFVPQGGGTGVPESGTRLGLALLMRSVEGNVSGGQMLCKSDRHCPTDDHAPATQIRKGEAG